ncbi:TonB-dependent receptor [Microbulbifer celer]|uniref:TonB-dependent receptor n=1 Tax=Microbulbifer celer TaxID=435905 RepID=A0ABW3U4D9_9GAMM|nr:TonB-dependent receptor [Microbulbifer celer]UFN57635.1 TonB-dependent receptor [Microbulbifer celer]
MQGKYNHKLLSIAVCSAVYGLLPGNAVAQDAAQEKIAPESVEEVVVYGDIRATLQSAQAIKRDADTVKDVITASDIGALPDKSVTEALQRVPGVSIERFAASDDPNHYADEGTGVLVRGLDRVRSEINGRDSFSANPNGGLNFEDISPELLGAVEVVKNQTADMIAGGIAGTVNLVTRKPFDADGRMVAGTVKSNYGDFREEATPTSSGLFSDVWETDAGDFGVLVSASHSELATRGDGIGVANYYSRGDSHIHVGAGWDPSVVAGTAPDSPVEGPVAFDGQPEGSVYYTPGQYSLRSAENDRERTGFASSFQWRSPDDSVITTLEYVRSDASLEWRENVIGPQAQGFEQVQWFDSRVLTDVPAGMEPTWDESNRFTSGVLSFGANMPMHLSSRYNETETSVEDLSFNVNWQATDRLNVALDVQRVDSNEEMINNGINARAQHTVSDVYLDLSGSRPSIEFLNERLFTPDYTPNWDGDRPDVFLATALDTATDSDASMNAVKLDLDYELGDGWARTLSGGVYSSDKDLTVRDSEYSNWGAVNTPWNTALSMNGDYNAISDEFERQNWGGFYQGGILEGRNDFLMIDMASAKDFANFMRRACEEGFNTAPYGETNIGGASDVGQSNPDCYQAMEDMAGRVAPGSPFAPHDITSTNEKRAEAYVRFDFADDELDTPYRGNFGLRYVSYQLESTGYTVMPNVSGEGAEFLSENLQAFADGMGAVSTVDGTDYTTVLPSFNLALNLREDVVMRFGASESLYFPNLRDTRNSRIVNLSYNVETDGEGGPATGIVPGSVQINGTSRNPFLEPEEALNIDLSTEWYFSDTGALALALFRKDIDNLFRERPFLQEVTNPRTGVTESVSFNGPANDGSGSIQGFEVSYSQFFDNLPGAWSGLGVQMNYTYIDQNDLNDPMSDAQLGAVRFDTTGAPISDGRNSFRAFTDLPLPGYSDESYNIVGMYEYEDLSMRLAYNWRSEYLVTRRDSNEFAPVYAKAAGFLDGSAYYHLTDNIQVGLEASNILNTETRTELQLDQQGTRTDSLNFITDRRYALSLRAKF